MPFEGQTDFSFFMRFLFHLLIFKFISIYVKELTMLILYFIMTLRYQRMNQFILYMAVHCPAAFYTGKFV